MTAEDQNPFDLLPRARVPTDEFGVADEQLLRDILDRTPELPPLPADFPAYRPRVLFIDDEESLLLECREIYESTRLQGYAILRTFHFRDAAEEELVTLLQSSFSNNEPFDTIYVDRQMEGAGEDAGLGLIRRLIERIPKLRYTPFVIVTAFPDAEMSARARDLGVIRIIIKTNPIGAKRVFGTLVHRLITEARETLEQAEDQIWTDANILTSERLGAGAQSSTAVQSVFEFLSEHFSFSSIYARRWDKREQVFSLLAGKDGLGIQRDELPVRNIPALNSLVHDSSGSHHIVVNSLTRAQTGSDYAHLVGYRVIAAQIRAGGELLGLLTMYRNPGEREFRHADAYGLHHVASQIAAAMAREGEMRRLNELQHKTVSTVQRLDQAEHEAEVYKTLQTALFELISTSDDDIERVKVSIRKIVPGRSDTQRAIDMRGMRGERPAGPISLEQLETSSIARAINSGASEYCGDLSDPNIRARYTLVSDRIRSTLAVPLISRGVCVGAACLESVRVQAFPEDTRSLAQLLSECAADALVRLRMKHFMLDVGRLFGSVMSDSELQTPEIISRFVRLIFALTGAAELQYLTKSDDRWVPSRGFVYPGDDMPPPTFRRWKDHLARNWADSFVRAVVYGGGPEWTDREGAIVSDRELRGGVETRTQAVLQVTTGDHAPIDSVFALYFLHRNAMNESLVELLKVMVRALAQLLSDRRRVETMYGLSQIRDQEARLGQIFGQIRHRLRMPLVIIAESLASFEKGVLSQDAALKGVRAELKAMSAQIDRNKGMIKVPRRAPAQIHMIWNKARRRLLTSAKLTNARISTAKSSLGSAKTDPEILEEIFFNLIDNAIIHGGPGVEVSIARLPDSGTMAVLEITDTGRGFAASVIEQFGSPAVSTDAQSTGMGIYLSTNRAVDLLGKLRLVSSKPKCTRLHLSLPRE